MAGEIRVFVGGQTEHRLCFAVLKHSILRHTQSPVEVKLICDLMPKLQEPQSKKNRPATSFSLQRFAIPELCGFEGRGIYLDSDMIVRADIRELWELPFPKGSRVLAPPGWQTSVLLWDCAYRVTIAKLVRDMDAGTRGYAQVMNAKGLKVARTIPGEWNRMDRYHEMGDPHARLLHYTSMNTQPWLYAGHTHEVFWRQELDSALGAGAITKDDVMVEIARRHVRPSLATVVGQVPPYPDSEFVFPNDARHR